MEAPEIEIRRNSRRTKTVKGYMEHGRFIVEVPARLSPREIDSAAQRLLKRWMRARTLPDNESLAHRAHVLAQQYLADQSSEPFPQFQIRWVGNQQQRWGSCSPHSGEIRISDRVQPMPDYVVDYVIMHELTHLLEPSHNRRFHDLVGAYPLLEKARSYLDGYVAGAGWEARNG